MIAVLVVFGASASLALGLARIAISWVAAGDQRDPSLAGTIAVIATGQTAGRHEPVSSVDIASAASTASAASAVDVGGLERAASGM